VQKYKNPSRFSSYNHKYTGSQCT